MRKLVAGIAASLMVAAVAAGPSDADQASTSKVRYFKATVSPGKNVKPGMLLTSKGTGAMASTAYYCLIAAYEGKAGGTSAPDQRTLKVVKSTRVGKLACKVKYEPFKAKDGNGHMRHCPTTKADKRDGFKCGVAYADQATVGARSESVAPFVPAKK